MASRLWMNGADRRMKTRDHNESGSFPDHSIGPKSYSYGELARVTGHFSLNNLIGRGGFGHVFKASLDGEICAIKRLDFPDVQSEGGLEREIMVVKSVSHRNLVELVGYCIDGANRLLILKYFPNGSLRSKLHGNGNILDWKTRMNIAIGSARGLEYLHEHCKPKIIHLDIKSDNILLDDDFEPKISDFGLALFFTDAATHISKSSTMGTQVYADPLTTQLGKYSDKSDIYSFGVTLLELITGRKPKDKDIDIVTWANRVIKKVLEGRYANFVDPKLQFFDHKEMHRIIFCINSCLNQPPNSRPPIGKIRLVLEGILPPEELYNYQLQWSITHKDGESSSYFEEDDQIEESGSLHEKNYKGFGSNQNLFNELAVATSHASAYASAYASDIYRRIGPKQYSINELANATAHFSLNNLLRQSGFNQVFKGLLDDEPKPNPKPPIIQETNNYGTGNRRLASRRPTEATHNGLSDIIRETSFDDEMDCVPKPAYFIRR